MQRATQVNGVQYLNVFMSKTATCDYNVNAKTGTANTVAFECGAGNYFAYHLHILHRRYITKKVFNISAVI